MGSESSASLQELIERLIGPDYKASYEASCELITLGDKAVTALDEALQHVSVESQKMPIYATLKDMRSKAAASVLLSYFLKESNHTFRLTIIKGLGLAKYQKAGPVLEQVLTKTQDQELSWSLQIALAHLGEQEERYRHYFMWLLERTEDLDRGVRVKAVIELKTFADPIAKSKLLEKLQLDEYSAIRALALLSLVHHNPESIQKSLEQIVEMKGTEAGLFALLGLCYLKKSSLPIAIEELNRIIKHRIPQERVAAIRVLSWFYPPENGVEILTLLIHFLKTDPNLSVKREVVGIIDRFRPVDVSTNAREAVTILQTLAEQMEENELQLLAAVALVKLGYLQYLSVVRDYLLKAKVPEQSLSSFVLFGLDAELQNDIIPFLLDCIDYLPNLEVRSIVEFLLIGKYWRDPRLLPYFRECLEGRRKTNVLWVAQNLLAYSKEGYKPAYQLLKDFLGEEPSEAAIKRYFFWLSSG